MMSIFMVAMMGFPYEGWAGTSYSQSAAAEIHWAVPNVWEEINPASMHCRKLLAELESHSTTHAMRS